MGKRKERRLAAKISANRRVKLDLFEEPSGEVMGTSVQDEVGGNLDQDHLAGVPTSPSSSGKNQENPLLLLGQYSDDELEEETSKQPKHDTDGSSSTDLDGQEHTEVGENVKGDIEKDTSDGENKQEPDQVNTGEILGDSEHKEDNGSNHTDAQCCETDAVTQDSIPESSANQIDGDLTAGWKVVMQEGSNQYYYWNTVTGETSWEVPTALAAEQTLPSGTELAGSTHLSAESAAYGYVSAVDVLGNTSLIPESVGDYGSILETKNDDRGLVHLGYDANQSLAHYSAAVAGGVPYVSSSAVSDFHSSLTAIGASGVDCHAANVEDKDKHLKMPNECYETADIHSAQLMKYSESLLQRLEELDRTGYRLERHEWIMKEIEIRLSDCKALSPYGSALLPFWWHTEAHLKQLEIAINRGEASQLTQSQHELEAAEKSSLRNECSLQYVGAGSEVIMTDKGLSSTVTNSCPSSTDAIQMEDTSQIPDMDDVKNKELSPESPLQPPVSEQEPEIIVEAHPNTSAHVLPKVESRADEDMDMDVEMEVDEEIPSGQIAAAGNVPDTECSFLAQQLVQPNQPLPECPLVPIDEPSIPPPPDEEWIPPPPPDSEPIPPPPPEEPPASPIPPPYPDTLPCPPYQDQYNLGYTVPSYDYYASAGGEIANGNYYAHADVSHITDPQPPPYYEPVVSSAISEATVVVNQAESVAYYDVSSGAVPPGPVVSSTAGYYIEAGPISYPSTLPSSDHAGSAGLAVETGSSLLPTVNLEPEIPAVVSESWTSALHAASVAASAQSVGTALVSGSAADAPQAAAKNQTKVVRSKKRTIAVAPTLRSNKKVSSMVDKWKAAKEELHGKEDEEPKNAYEVLEKKRQREIEEWRTRQIASGEAQDNANFLPLGGDWRERVKRKRAKAEATSVEASIEVADNESKQPDLVELSKDLPSGWQAYWDESSKEVYYGNTITSDTTWTRPTR